MLSFPVKITPGAPIYEQIVFAAKRAIATGVLKSGDRFPSVRAMSDALGVNPNTVQKAVSELTTQGLLDVHPGRGCFIANRESSSKTAQRKALTPLIEQLLVEARQHGLSEKELIALIQTQRKTMLQTL